MRAVYPTGDPAVVPSAAVADLLILHHPTLEEAQAAYAQHQAEAAAAGRAVRVLQAVLPILGATEAAAQTIAAALDAVAPPTAAAPRIRIVGTPAQVADQLAACFAATAECRLDMWPHGLRNEL